MRINKNLLLPAFAALSLTTALCAPAWAAKSSMVIGLSADGKTLLTYNEGQSGGDDVYRLTFTATGESIEFAPPAGASYVSPEALSADGKTVTGHYYSATLGTTQSFIWSKDTGYVTLNIPGQEVYAYHISADGSAIAGEIWDSQTGARPFYWSADSGLLVLDGLGGTWGTRGIALSSDGTTLVGASYDLSNHQRAVIWNGGSAAALNIDTLYVNSSATHVSANGSVVAGRGLVGHGDDRAFRWTQAGGMVDIGTLGGQSTHVKAMTRDGNILVGESDNGINTVAMRYIAASSTMSDLGSLGGTYSSARAVNAGGSVIVGTATDMNEDDRAFRWTEETGMLTIEAWLAVNGVTPGDYVARYATHVSDDGNVVAGETADHQTFYARVGNVSGIITLEEFLPTVANVGAAVVAPNVRHADTVMFGAQGQPMRNLLAPGQKAVWGTVDIGHDSTDGASGGLAVGEFGFGYGVADGITARLSAGVVHSNLDLNLGGSVTTTGYYLSPEASIELADNIYLTVGGYVSGGSISSTRGYLNGGTTEYSSGETSARTFGAKVRLDWVDALVVEDTSFTPYIGLSYANSTVDSYTETGGAFPVTYNDITQQSTIVRLGADMVHHLTDDFRVVAKAELAYQLEDTASPVSGTIIGANSFSLSGGSQNQFWVRGGIGAEYDVGGGTASLMLNVTSNGQDPDVWVRSNFTVKF